MAYASKGNYDKAIGDYSDAVRLKPTNARAYYERGLAYAKTGETAKAEEDFGQAKKLWYKAK